MIDVIKKSLEIGLGAVMVTREKLQEITDELVVKGDLSKKEGSAVLKELVATADKSQKKMKSLIDDQIHKTIKEAGIATNADIKALEGKISKLEAQLAKVTGNVTGRKEAKKK